MSTPSDPLAAADPLLDRRLRWARALMAEGDAAAAAGLLADTVAQAPSLLAGWFLLGEARRAAGDDDGAVAAFRTALAQDPQDRLGAGLQLARLGAAPAATAMSATYVRTLFDQYADRFDAALRDNLGYRGPELLHDAVLRAAALRGRATRFGFGLDLGCGTGLAAPLFAPLTEELAGIDLSPAMLAKAQALGLYARLEAAEMGAALAATEPGRCDLVIAADALCYVAELGPLFAAARAALAADGLFAFTLETPGSDEGGDGVLLRETLRFAHPRRGVSDALAAAGLATVLMEEASTRTEKRRPVPGLVVVATPDAG